MKEYSANYTIENKRIALVAARFNELVTKQLVQGAEDGLIRHGVKEEEIELFWVPGAFELPLAAQAVARSGRFHGIICLGAVIRGSTSHFDYVAAEVSKGIASLSLKENLPVIFSVLTTEDMEQALERAGCKGGNKGFEAAMTVIEMVNLLDIKF